MFASIELAARIERAEARLSASLGRALLASKLRPEAFVEEVGGGVAVFTSSSSPMNKMIGVGFSALPSADHLQAIEERFSARRAPLQAEMSTLADPSFGTILTRRGYVLQGFENVLGRPLTPGDGVDARRENDITVDLMADAERSRWLDVMAAGFMQLDGQGVQAEPIPPRDDLEVALRDFTDAPGFRRYCARIAGQVTGVATMRVDDHLAQFCGAATLPAFRRRGVQSALLRRRLADAFHDGCELALMTTSPGSKSEENGHRQGFRLLYSRALLVKYPD